MIYCCCTIRQAENCTSAWSFTGEALLSCKYYTCFNSSFYRQCLFLYVLNKIIVEVYLHECSCMVYIDTAQVTYNCAGGMGAGGMAAAVLLFFFGYLINCLVQGIPLPAQWVYTYNILVICTCDLSVCIILLYNFIEGIIMNFYTGLISSMSLKETAKVHYQQLSFLCGLALMEIRIYHRNLHNGNSFNITLVSIRTKSLCTVHPLLCWLELDNYCNLFGY